VSIEVIRRPPRRAAPPLPTGDLPLEPPPAIPQPTGARWQQYLMALPMLAGTVATALMFGGRDGAGPYTYVVGAIFGLSTLGMLVINLGTASGPRKAELMAARRDYLRYLAGVRRKVRATIVEQREALLYRHPDPQSLWSEAMGWRVWERRPTDADFGVVRVGVGPQALATPLIAPSIDPTTDLEPVTAGALYRFLDTYSVVPDLPISIAIRAFSRVLILDRTGGDAGGRALARAMVGQLATFHAPDDLVVAACVSPDRRREWEWLKWLPHALHPTDHDALGQRRLVVSAPSELDDLLADLVAKRPRFQPVVPGGRNAEPPTTPHILIVVDGVEMTGSAHFGIDGGLAGVTLLQIGGGLRAVDRTTITLAVDEGGVLRGTTMDTEQEVGRADALSLAEADSLARRMAPLRLSQATREQAPLAADRDLTELLGIDDIATADIAQLWAPRPPRDLLRIPIGTGERGGVVYLDLKEAAQDGMGPHGMIVGATGSGKSELLRTLVLGLAATHSSETLNFVLVDFKGGATFASLERLPHTSAVITNLADELPLVDRMHDALTGELIRRQELLRRAGNFASLRDYNRARASGAPLPPLPSLLLVCDEFTEMLTAKPEFIDIFLQIGRIGRSVGVHLLLATQRLEEGRLRGLDANLSYRIALRTFSALESRAVIGGPEAASLPSTPGHGYLAVATEPPQRFKAAYVSGPYRQRSTSTAAAPVVLRMYDYSTAHVPDPQTAIEAAPVTPSDENAPTLMDVIVDRLAGQGPPAHQVWLPPLRESPMLDELFGGLVTDPVRGITTTNPGLRGTLSVPMAIVDKPLEQRRDVAWLDLSGANGHLAIAGGPQSGKSTLVRTIVCALALSHTPTEVQVYCLDFGGGSLGSLRDLPHVGGVASRLDQAQVRRTVGEMATLLADRERRFAERGIDSMATFRRLRRPSTPDATLVVPEDGFGDVFLVIDGWSTIRSEFEELEPVLVDIATRGLNYGIHLIVTATRWLDIRMNIKDLFGSKVELRLGDPSDSTVNRKLAANVPAGVPGRGLTAEGLHLLTALPQVTGHPPATLIRAIAEAWTGPSAPAVRMLPTLLPYSALLAPDETGRERPIGEGLALPIGIAEADLRPVTIDFATEPHLLVFGDESGKSSFLRSLAESIVRRFTPEQARIILVDYRRSLLGTVTTEHLIGYGTEVEYTSKLIASAAMYMEKRRPGPDVTPEQLRTRSWWEGPELFVLVDDYDLVAGGRNPLQPLLEYLSQARDVGLHLVLARRAGGAARALYDPIIQRLRELGSPGLVMSGDREEGVLLGNVRPSALPPGRGWLVTRRQGARLVQLAYLEPPAA
jgi:type VII secretion protein EccCa/type VII secretion protein EccCb